MSVIINNPLEMQRRAEDLRQEGTRIAVIPTMGFLHEGHLSLIRLGRQHSDVVITTIFVNPTQFGPSEDFHRYPRDLDADVTHATEAGTDYIFAPETEAMYPAGYQAFVDLVNISTVLEGKSRPGHFRGVATVVAKLFNITKPHVAIFGQKDAQQAAVIRQMVQDMNIDVKLIVAPIVREPDGLAMSSRNVFLSPEQRREAPVLFRSLQLAEQRIRQRGATGAQVIGEMKKLIESHSSGQVDYISIADSETLEELNTCESPRSILISLAVRFGSTRLIDNVLVNL